jgi:hypothetical protein
VSGGWKSKFAYDAQTAYYFHGTYKAMAEAYGISTSTAWRWVNDEVVTEDYHDDPSILEQTAIEEIRSDKEGWVQDEGKMTKILINANKQELNKKVKRLEESKKETDDELERLSYQDEIDILKASDEKYEAAYSKAFNTDDSDAWADFRAIHEARGGS